MLGSGRPFLVEVQNARQVPSELLVKEIEEKINNMENKLVSSIPGLWWFFFHFWLSVSRIHWISYFLVQVKVKNLKAVGSQGWDLMREGEAEKQVIFPL